MSDDAIYDIHAVLAHYGWELPGERTGWVSVRCGEHDDSHASCRINYDLGAVACLGCGFKGDAISVIRQKEQVSYREAVRIAEEITAAGGGEVRRERGGRRRVSDSPRYNASSRAYIPPGRRSRTATR